jgi:hypothetical protein
LPELHTLSWPGISLDSSLGTIRRENVLRRKHVQHNES